MKETENQQPVKGEEIEMVLEAKGRKAEIVTNPAEKSVTWIWDPLIWQHGPPHPQ